MVSGVHSIAAAAGATQANTAKLLGAQGESSATSTPFADLMNDAVGTVNQLEKQADAAVTGLMTGSGVNVHQAMIADEKAGLAFEMVLAVRNKAVEAYQSMMGMQF